MIWRLRRIYPQLATLWRAKGVWMRRWRREQQKAESKQIFEVQPWRTGERTCRSRDLGISDYSCSQGGDTHTPPLPFPSPPSSHTTTNTTNKHNKHHHQQQQQTHQPQQPKAHAFMWAAAELRRWQLTLREPLKAAGATTQTVLAP